MNFAYRTYNLLSSGVFIVLFPPFWLYSHLSGRYRRNLSQRLGLYPKKLVDTITGSPRIWMHAASVGEVSVAASIIESLCKHMPDCAVILSTTTEHGQAFAKDKLGSKVTYIYPPLDFIASVRKAFLTLKPDILICLETEIWPHWLIEAYRLGIQTAFVNGRISIRSIKGYLRARPLIRTALEHVGIFSMIREEDGQRIKMMGAPAERIEINGNAKYDLLLQHIDMSYQTKMKKLFNLKGDEPVFVAGSTRNPEEKIVLDVYQKVVQLIPETILIIVPRHVERTDYLKTLIKDRGLDYQLRTGLTPDKDPRTAPVVLVDTIGDLQAIYSLASVVFCGGSLVPLGGQNILEAAAWGKPVLYGPSMDDFLDAKALLEKTGGGIQVADDKELAEKVEYYLKNPEAAKRAGASARKAVMSNKGAAGKHAAAIHRLLT